MAAHATSPVTDTSRDDRRSGSSITTALMLPHRKRETADAALDTASSDVDLGLCGHVHNVVSRRRSVKG
jgi:hypothetical protein